MNNHPDNMARQAQLAAYQEGANRRALVAAIEQLASEAADLVLASDCPVSDAHTFYKEFCSHFGDRLLAAYDALEVLDSNP